MKRNNDKAFRDFTTEQAVNEQMRDSIGIDLVINDNLDIDLDFESPENVRSYRRVNKIVGHSSLFVCLQGEVEMILNSQPCVMHTDDANYAQSGHIGEVKRFSPDTRFFLVICKDSFYMPPLSAVEAAAFRRELVTHPVAHLSKPQAYGVTLLYKMIRNALAKRDEIHFVRRTVQGLMQAMFFQVFSAYQSESSSSSQLATARQEEIFKRFIKLVEKNYVNERNIGFYADKLCITPKYLSQLIYKASGIYAGDHIDNYVIGEAKMLIKSRKYTIAQVSDMLNFTSQAYFGRYFKKHTGMTPLEFADKG